MSFFPFGNIPTIQTRKALLLLDFQNDFVRPAGALHVPNTPEILETLPSLAAAFRKVGDVIWVRSLFESSKPINEWGSGDRIVLENEAPRRQQRQLPKSDVIEIGSDRDSPELVDAEAFLSAQSATCCAAQTTGFQFPAPLLAAINPERDIVLDKTAYSALESRELVLSFRSRFVTEVYICGSLSNVSVYATALDAVHNGFSVTLVEDCLGFRDFGRHREAMRRMADILGATGLTANELLQELDWQETDNIAQGIPAAKRPAGASLGLEGILESFGVQAEEEALDDVDNGEEYNLAEIVQRTRALRGSSASGRPSDNKPKMRARVRRPKRQDATPEPTPQNHSSHAQPVETSEKTDGGLGEGDSRLVPELDLPNDIFERIHAEVSWMKMFHLSGQVPRLVAVQGSIDPDGAIPIYRHPADESPPLKHFTPAVDQARIVVEQILGHPLNHVLIQLYRDGHDNISEHSDKTLDISRGSFICNVSLGAQRPMTLRTKVSATPKEGCDSGRITQRVQLPHKSLFILGQKTNMRWLHGIRADKRPEYTKSAEEQAFGGQRISLTFRHIGTYLDERANVIWGQGAVAKSRDIARPVIHGHPEETERLIHAFGQENKTSDFDWNAVYGGGFDVVNFVTASPPSQLSLSGDVVADLRVRIGLGENGIRYEVIKDQGMEIEGNNQPRYTDPQGFTVFGDLAILRHLASRPAEAVRPGIEILRGGTHLSWIQELLENWRQSRAGDSSEALQVSLGHWERALEGQHYLGGTVFGIDDCALWPVLRDLVQTNGPFDSRLVNLNQYYYRVEKRGIVRIILDDSQ